MRIEKLNENKIRIFLNLDDLKEKNIDLHDFMSNSQESQNLFLDMLTLADEEVGFNTHNYKLIIEAFASSDGYFVLTITRVKPEGTTMSKVHSPKVKRKITTPSKTLSIYKFNTFDEFCEFCKYISSSSLSNFISTLKKSSLYLYNDNYYLILNDLKLNTSELKKLAFIMSEFGNSVRNEFLFERKLKEYGKVIMPKNAILTCLKYFN